MSEITKLLFKERKELEDRFIKWADKNGAALCPSNVIAWLTMEKREVMFRKEAVAVAKALGHKESGILATTEHFLIKRFEIDGREL